MWRKHEDQIIMQHWGAKGRAGMPQIRKMLPHHSTSEIFGRRWLLMKKAREKEAQRSKSKELVKGVNLQHSQHK